MTGVTRPLPTAPDTGIPTWSFPTGGLLAASQTRAPLTEEAVVTMDIRRPILQAFEIFLNQFLLQILVFILGSVSVRALIPV